MTTSGLRILVALSLSAGLAACASRPAPDAVADARTPTEQFVAQVSQRPEEIRLAIHAQGLSANQAGALAAYVEVWRAAEGGAIQISTPGGAGPDAAAAYRTADGVRARLSAEGVPDRLLAMTGYEAGGATDAPIIVSYVRYEASLPECGQKWTNLAHSATNQVQPNFGCAVTANMAAQVANPADLVGARAMDPADAGRRAVVLEKYRAGQVTSAASDDKANGAVSRAVN